VASLETAEIAPEIVNTVVVVEESRKPETPSRVIYQRSPPAAEPESQTRDFLWIGLGLIGFWVALLALLGLVLLVK
jgi:hypothetical protein